MEEAKQKIEYTKYQQGDVVMYKLNDEDFKQYDNKDKGSNNYQIADYEGNTRTKAVLAFGEVTGHTHRIDMSEMVSNAGITLHMQHNGTAGTDIPRAFEVHREPVELQHEEHDTVTLPPVKYVIHIVREFNHITRRAQYVAD